MTTILVSVGRYVFGGLLIAGDPVAEGVAADLTMNTGPIAPVLQRIDPALAQPVTLTDTEFTDLLAFLRDGLLDERALPENLAPLIPTSVPSGLSLHTFESTPPTHLTKPHVAERNTHDRREPQA